MRDESITNIVLLDRANESGYARQNGLLPNTWIDIHFGGELPTTVTGKITNLEEWHNKKILEKIVERRPKSS